MKRQRIAAWGVVLCCTGAVYSFQSPWIGAGSRLVGTSAHSRLPPAQDGCAGAGKQCSSGFALSMVSSFGKASTRKGTWYYLDTPRWDVENGDEGGYRSLFLEEEAEWGGNSAQSTLPVQQQQRRKQQQPALSYEAIEEINRGVRVAPSITPQPDLSPLNPPPDWDKEQRERKANFTVNLGEVIDTLEHDVPLMFEQAPNMDIFTQDIELKDPKGSLSRGKRLYGAMFASLRVIGRIAGGGHQPTVRMLSIKYNEEEETVELRLQLSFGGSLLLGGPITLDAVSIYRLNDEARVYEHCFDNVLKRHLWEYSASWKEVLSVSTPRQSTCSVSFAAATATGADGGSESREGGGGGGVSDGNTHHKGHREFSQVDLAAEAYDRIRALLPYPFTRRP